MRMRTLWVMLIGSAITIGCSGDVPNTSDEPGQVLAPSEPVSVDKNDYPVFPEKDLDADPSVSADAGGAGGRPRRGAQRRGRPGAGGARRVHRGVWENHSPAIP